MPLTPDRYNPAEDVEGLGNALSASSRVRRVNYLGTNAVFVSGPDRRVLRTFDNDGEVRTLLDTDRGTPAHDQRTANILEQQLEDS